MIRRQVLAVLWVLVAAGAQGATTAEIDAARAKGLAWLVQSQRGDGSFAGSRGLEIQATAAAVEAMLAGGLTRSPQYARALSWLANVPPGSLDAQAWQTMALALAGRDATWTGTIIRDARNTSVAKAGAILGGNIATWGAYPGYGASIADTALGYGALRASGVTYPNDTTDLTVTVLCHVLPAQLTSAPWGGAWPQALPQNGQPGSVSPGSLAATAAMLYELKQARLAGRFLSATACSKSSPSAIDSAMTSAKTWLMAQANANGGFAERSPQTGGLEASNFAATALAVRALSLFAAGGDPAAATAVSNAQGWLVSQQGTDGAWQGDPFVTARALAALPAASGAQLADTDQDGLTDVVEQRVGTQTLTADAQAQLNNGANAMPGFTAAYFSSGGVAGQAFTYSIAPPGSSGPYTYALANGSLPPGLTLAANGTISGVPTTAGSFAFDYLVTDGTGTRTLVIGRVDVASPPAVPMPGWALLVLGGALAAIARRRARRGAAH